MSDTAATGQRCVIRRHPGRRPWAQTGMVVCTEHLAELRDTLADVADGWAELPFAGSPLAAPGPRYSEGRSPERPDAAPPVNLAVLALRHDSARSATVPAVTRERNGVPGTDRLESNGPDAPNIAGILAAWCERVAAERQTAVPAGGVPSMLSALRQHVSWIAGQLWVVEFDAELRDCRRWLAMAVGSPDTMPPPFGSCPSCGRLVWRDLDRDVIKRRRFGQDVAEATGRTDRVRCDCGAAWEGVHALARLLQINLDDQDRRATTLASA